MFDVGCDLLPLSWKRRADRSRLGDNGDLTVAIFRQSNEDATHHDVPPAHSAHLPLPGPGLNPRHGTFLG